MNYNLIFIQKAKEILFNKKTDLPLTVYNNFFKKIDDDKYELYSMKDVIKEIKCFSSLFETIRWYDDYQVTITQNDNYLVRGYMPNSFLSELKKAKNKKIDKNKLDILKEFSLDKIFSFSPKIMISFKENGVNIYDGYHRILAALQKKDKITFKCVVGIYNNEK